MACEVRQESDEMVCRCGLRWDVGDPDPPTCIKSERRKPLNYVPDDMVPRRFVEVTTAQIPVKLPANVAAKMAIAYGKQLRDDPLNEVEAMQAAYRVFMGSL